jgi:hypothetical protein
MAIIVVGGSERGVGKTALVCGLIAALPEFHWTAVKIASDKHGLPAPLWEETDPGQGSGTARYLAAGAQRAFLVTAPGDLAAALDELWTKIGPGANVIFESNRILNRLKPDLCLMVAGGQDPALALPKPSFTSAARHADATVARAQTDGMQTSESGPVFLLADLERVSPPMCAWLRERLGPYLRKSSA